jgi:hypothetical protein
MKVEKFDGPVRYEGTVGRVSTAAISVTDWIMGMDTEPRGYNEYYTTHPRAWDEPLDAAESGGHRGAAKVMLLKWANRWLCPDTVEWAGTAAATDTVAWNRANPSATNASAYSQWELTPLPHLGANEAVTLKLRAMHWALLAAAGGIVLLAADRREAAALGNDLIAAIAQLGAAGGGPAVVARRSRRGGGQGGTALQRANAVGHRVVIFADKLREVYFSAAVRERMYRDLITDTAQRAHRQTRV